MEKEIIDLSKLPSDVRDRILKELEKANQENNSVYKNVGEQYVVFSNTYYGGDYWYGSPIESQIRAYYKNPADKTSGVIEFKHYFHAVEIGKIREKDVVVIEEEAPNLSEIFDSISKMGLSGLLDDYSSRTFLAGHWFFDYNGQKKIQGTGDARIIQIERIKQLLGYEAKRKKVMDEIENKIKSPEFQEAVDEELASHRGR